MDESNPQNLDQATQIVNLADGQVRRLLDQIKNADSEQTFTFPGSETPTTKTDFINNLCKLKPDQLIEQTHLE